MLFRASGSEDLRFGCFILNASCRPPRPGCTRMCRIGWRCLSKVSIRSLRRYPVKSCLAEILQAQAPNFCASVLHRSAVLCHFQYQPENPEAQTLQWRRASGGGEGGGEARFHCRTWGQIHGFTERRRGRGGGPLFGCGEGRGNPNSRGRSEANLKAQSFRALGVGISVGL